MNDRLKQFLLAENITQAQFADNLNVVRASVSHVLSGRNKPGFDFIKAIMLKYPRLNIEWLIFGKGKMYKDSPVAAEEQLFPDYEIDPPLRITESLPETEPEESVQASNEFNTSDNTPQAIIRQRKVSKIIIMFDDGTFQEM